MEFIVKPSEGGSDFEQTLNQAVEAESLGFDKISLAEHHGFPSGPYWPSPLMGLSAIAARTSDIDLMTSIIQLPLANPVRLAGEMAFLDTISDGRAEFGFGLGWRPIEFNAMNVPKRERGARMSESLLLLDRLLTSETVSFDGEFFEFDSFELSPRPVQTPRPDFLVGGTSKPAFGRAANLAEGWISPGGTLSESRDYVDRLVDAGGGRVVLTTDGVIVRESTADALSDAEEFIRLSKEPHLADGNPHVNDPDITDIEDYLSDRLFVVGDADGCIEKLQRIETVTGCDEIILRISCTGWSEERTAETLRLLGDEVLPSFE